MGICVFVMDDSHWLLGMSARKEARGAAYIRDTLRDGDTVAFLRREPEFVKGFPMRLVKLCELDLLQVR